MDHRGYELRAPEPHEHDALVSCIETCFTARLSATKRSQLVAGLDPLRTLAAFDDLSLVGTSAGYAVELTLPGLDVVPALVLADVTVLPTHRRRGILTALMRRTIDEAHEREDLVVALEASEGGIYGRFGFGAATTSSSYVMDRSASALVGPGFAPTGNVVLLEAKEATEAFPLVFDVARRQRAGEIARRSWWWEELIEPEPDSSASGSMRFLAAYEEGGSIDGYAVYEVRPKGERGREVVLEECCTTSAAAYVGLFAYLIGIDLTDGLRTGPRPVDEPLRHLLANPRALRTSETRDGTWLRLVDAVGALRARRYASARRVVCELIDEFCPWNSGRIEIEAGDDGRARVDRTAAQPDLSFDAGSLATVYLGGSRATSLVRAGRVVEHVAGAAATLDAMLYCDPLPFCMTL